MSSWNESDDTLTPDRWTIDALGNVATLQRGFDLPIQDRKGGVVPVYGSNGIDGFHSATVVKGPGVITGRSGTIGFVHYQEGSYWPLNTTLYVKDFHENYPKFVYYLLQTLELKKFAAATGVPSLNRNFVHPLEISIPPLPEQRKIAKILTTVDNLIEKTEALIAKYQAIKQGMMHDLFTRSVDEHGHLRPPYDEAPKLYKESELGWIPKEWEVNELRHYLSYISYGFTNPMPETQEGPWMATAANIFNGAVQFGTCRHTSQEAFDNLLTNKSRPIVGDLLLTKDGTLGRVAIVDRQGICINQSVAVLRSNDRGNPTFLKLLLETPKYQQKMLDNAGGSTIKHIYITIIDQMLIAVPKQKREQKGICDILLILDQKLQEEQNYWSKLQSVKTGLMQDLLTGKVRVKIDEPAEAVA